jgi:hypothetical protein
MNDILLNSIKDHLEFVGYSVEITDEEKLRLKARNPLKANIAARRFRGGLIFSATYGCKDEAKTKKNEMLQFANAMNELACVIHCYADKDNDFMIEAWYPGTYVKQDFAIFLDNLNDDISKMFAALNEAAVELLK